MTSYNSLDGIPSTSSKALLTDLLRKEWGFRGFVVSDLYSVDGIWHTHHVARDRQQAGIMALQAGVDADLGALAFAPLADAVKKGLVKEEEINQAVRNILRLKFEMGLFENPYVNPEKAKTEVRSNGNVSVARSAALEAVTLLKNENNILPLGKSTNVLVCGPNADNIYNMLGDYTAPQEPGNVKTVLEGIRHKLPASQIEYVKGCAVRDINDSNIQEAVSSAQKADVVIAVVGGSSARDFKTSYKDTGAAVTDSKTVSDMDCGEGFDRATLTPLGRQTELLEALKRTGKPLVVVYIEGRPMDKSWAAQNANALLTAYYPGQEGGTAIADILFGDYNPAGRLPVSVPANIGQLPVYYNKRPPLPHDYVEMSAQPLYAFGYGLSYTTFEYDNLNIEKLDNTKFRVTLDVKNTGQRDGDEVVQLYLHDECASTTRPLMQLKKFERIFIPAGETRQVSFTLGDEDLSIVNADMQWAVEPGDFTVMIGSSSDNIRLKSKITVE